MKITHLETILPDDYPGLIFVQVHTDAGLIGLGDTAFGVDGVAAHIHKSLAPYLAGKNPLHIERIWSDLYQRCFSATSRGVEMRALSAIDIALWDIFGQATDRPIYDLLGGPVRDRISVYNTCCGYRYSVARADELGTSIDPKPMVTQEGPYEDLDAFLSRPDELALSLLEEGITSMKIWPFDQFATKTRGQSISTADLAKGCEPFHKIRAAVGDAMDIALEMHTLWNLPSAIRIAKAVEEYQPMWFEDPVRMDNIDSLRQFKDCTHVPTVASETVATRYSYRVMFEKQATSICMPDVAWCGGISEAKRIATMAEAYHLPVAPHDCTGPVTMLASIHLCMNLPNALTQEMVRAFYFGWYPELVTALPRVEDGHIYAPEGPGLGTTLRPDLVARRDGC